MSSNPSDEIDALASRLETIIELNDDVLDKIGEFDFEPQRSNPSSQRPKDINVDVMFG